MRVVGYCYPWDVLEAPGFADRARELGVHEVAVAVAYHSARAATPWSLARSSVIAPRAALYRPVREAPWLGARLRPAAATWSSTQDNAGDAIRIARAEGLDPAAWIVLTHNSMLGERFPDIAVRNCFGEVYPWALCPSGDEVREYAATLAAECLADLDVSSVVLESCGQMGAVHQHQHEKSDAVWSPAAARLLSVCCCDGCRRRWSESGVDAEEIRVLLCEQVRRLISSGEVDATEDGLPGEVRSVLLGTRQRATDSLRRAVLEAVGSERRIVLHGSADPWAVGALPGLTPTAASEVDAVVLPCWQAGAGAIDGVRSVRAEVESTVDVGAYVTAVGLDPLPNIGAYVRDLGRAGANELHLYHLGLAGPARWPTMRSAVAAARSA